MYKVDLKKLLTKEEYERLKEVDKQSDKEPPRIKLMPTKRRKQYG